MLEYFKHWHRFLEYTDFCCDLVLFPPTHMGG